MVSNLLADAYENCFGASVRAQDRPKLIAGLFDHESETPFHTRALTSHASHAHESKKSTPDPTNCAPTRNASWTTTSKSHSTDDNTVMASVEDYRYFLDELNELNMLVTRAATDEEYANSVKKLYMSFQQLNRALRTDEENIKEQLNRINSMLKGQQFGPQGGRLSLDVTFSPIDRQFETTLSRILSKLEDWTRNASDNPTETRKAFNNCETFVNRLHNELDKIHDTNGIKSIRRTQPRPTRTQLILRNRAPRQRPRRTHQLHRRKIRRSPPRTHLIRLRRSPHLPPRRRPHRTPHLHHALPRRSTHQSRRPLHQTRSPYYPDSASKSSSPPRKAKPRKSSTSPTEHTSHTKTHPPATHTYRNSTAKPSHRTKHSPPPHPRNQQRRHNPWQRPEAPPTATSTANSTDTSPTISPSTCMTPTPPTVAQNHPITQTSRTRSPLHAHPCPRRSHPQLGTTTPLRNQRKTKIISNGIVRQTSQLIDSVTIPDLNTAPQHHHTTNTQTLPTRTPTRTHHHQPIQPRLQHLHKHRQNPQKPRRHRLQPRHTNRTLLCQPQHRKHDPTHGPHPRIQRKMARQNNIKPLQSNLQTPQTRTTSPQRPPRRNPTLRPPRTPQPTQTSS